MTITKKMLCCIVLAVTGCGGSGGSDSPDSVIQSSTENCPVDIVSTHTVNAAEAEEVEAAAEDSGTDFFGEDSIPAFDNSGALRANVSITVFGCHNQVSVGANDTTVNNPQPLAQRVRAGEFSSIQFEPAV
jgi:hypothetical protein